MNEDGPDLVEQLHREAVRRRWEEEERGRALVEQLHRAEVERYREEEKRIDELIDRLHREAAAQARQHSQPPGEPPTIHYTELPAAKADSPLYHEWNTYR